MRRLRSAACAAALALPAAAAGAQTFPIDSVALPPPAASGYAAVDGVRLWYGIYGQGSPVVLVHGGIVSSWIWGKQIPALAARYRVIVVDNRGHGRSTRTDEPFSYHQMAEDLLGVLDSLHVGKVALIGWSDGANVGMDIAIHHPGRLTKLFVFGGNTDPDGLKDAKPTLEGQAFVVKARREYEAVSPTPTQFVALAKLDSQMDSTQPHVTAAQLHAITVPTWVADGDRDQFVKRENTDFMASQIPGASELILPGVDHGAPFEKPAMFNEALLEFLAQQEGDGAALEPFRWRIDSAVESNRLSVTKR